VTLHLGSFRYRVFASYITLPDGRRFAIVVFTHASDAPPVDRERAVAEVARTLYDYFLIDPANT
jgi:beta-lactamase class A